MIHAITVAKSPSHQESEVAELDAAFRRYSREVLSVVSPFGCKVPVTST
jgi:hypothetical protein